MALVAVAALVLVAGPALAKKSRSSDEVCAILQAPLTTEQVAAAVDSALAAQPGVVEKVAFRMGHAADGSSVVFLVVIVQAADGTLHPFYFDGETGDPLVPPTPTVSFNDAMATAVALAESEAPGLAPAQVLSGKLVNEVVNPVYLFAIVDPESRLVHVAVDAQTGDARFVDDPEVKKDRKRRRGRVHCDGDDSDSDDSDDSDGADSDETDSDSESAT